jgi:hypothetical protein
MMRANAGVHADQAWRQVGKPGVNLAPRLLLPQHDRSAPVKTDNAERVLANIDADYGDFSVEFQ